MKDGHNETGVGERKLIWDEENRLLAVDDNGFVSNYWYDADGERTVKTSGESDQVYVNGVFSGGSTNTTKFSLYVSPYLVANQGGRYTKHIYAGSQRIVSKIGDFASYGSDPRRIEYAGANTDGLSVDYKAKYAAQQQVIKDNYKFFDVPYNGTDNDNYADGEGFCCNDGTQGALLEANKARSRAIAKSFKDPDNYENLQFFYHPDHLGSSSFITNLEGEVVQHIEYVPFGEVFIEERNNVWNTPYLFNAKEFDEETGMYYYGARYYEPKLSLWMTTDPMEEDYPNVSSYVFCHNNPQIYIDPDGRGDYYNSNGLWLGRDKNNDNLVYLADGIRNNHFYGVKKLDVSHSDFQKISNIIKHETGTSDPKESLWLAHTVKNRADASGKTMLGLLLTGYSSVSKSEKQKGILTSDKSDLSNAARAGVIHALNSSHDPTGGAQFWDGTDFLAWGLSKSNGKPHNKFVEYSSITISKNIYDDFLQSQYDKYTSKTVKYNGVVYSLPATVFKDKRNWVTGNFMYGLPASSKLPKKLIATGTAGRTIFWKTEKR